MPPAYSQLYTQCETGVIFFTWYYTFPAVGMVLSLGDVYTA